MAKWSAQKYSKFLSEKRKELLDRDGSLDNAADFAKDLLMYTPGLGPYMRKKMHEMFPQMRLVNDIVNA